VGNDFDPESQAEREVAQRAVGDDQNLFSLLGDFYRGEVSHLTNESRRIDQSSDWAVAVMAAIITLPFSGRNMPSYLPFVGMAATCVFLVFEARRYRTYDAWRSRIRMVECPHCGRTVELAAVDDVDVEDGADDPA